MPAFAKKAIVLLLVLVSQLKIFAQTTGPTQPEVQSFQAATITNMVETSTGEFQYNIPLFEIGGYPININYNSQVGMENEASMVGLGFNLNCGAITRNVRGLPDDFNGDLVSKKMNMKPNITTGFSLGISLEFVGFDGESAEKATEKIGMSLTTSSGLFFNNYTGWGVESCIGAGFHANSGALASNAGIGISSNSNHGTDINPYFGMSVNLQKQFNSGKKYEREVNGKTEIHQRNLKVSAAMGAGYDFNVMSYTPKMDFPFKSTSMEFTGKAGYAGAYAEFGGQLKGYKSKQELQTNELSNPAYGFLYADLGKDKENALMDFNRENDGIMTEDKPNLPFSYATPDIYSVAGQGVGGVFELKRNNVFVGFDPKTQTNSKAGGTEFEIGGGTGAHIGAEVRFGYTLNTSEKWGSISNEFLKSIDFVPLSLGSSSNSAIGELTYFKNPNDVMFNTNPIYDLSSSKPIAPMLMASNYYGGKTYRDKVFLSNQVQNVGTGNFVNTKRDNRLEVIYYLTAQEASNFGIQKRISNYELNDFQSSTIKYIDRADGSKRKPDHLSEMICLKPDGTTYLFNVPAYNLTKREVSYSLNEEDFQNYETTHKPITTGTVSNGGRGRDEFISVTETPSYAHSFLLGAVLSANYVDLDDNGPSENDLGDYVKFNYSRADSNYYWRSNNSLNYASADPGSIADKLDGKAYYSEGTKEIWYIHSIESKNEISRFYYSDRQDAYNLKDPIKKLKRLDSILVFSRPELQNSNPVPFKRVYFNFDDASPLCTGVNRIPSLGKLTLKSIYFKNGTSNKGKFSAYKFGYSSNNPSYKTLATDRWGNYKDVNENTAIGFNLDNKEFPYVNQNNKNTIDQNASAWLLNKITLPTGGQISIDYEAHDYAYVQNKRAMSMVKVEGIGIGTTMPGPTDNDKLLDNANDPRNYLYFKLKNPIPTSVNPTDANQQILMDYFTDPLDVKYGQIVANATSNSFANLYGKFRVHLNSDFGYEDVPVFLDPKSCGVVPSSGSFYTYGYIQLEDATVDNTGTSTNQISKITWQLVKHQYSQILFGMDASPSLSAEEGIQALAGMFQPAVIVVKSFLNLGPDRQLRNKGVGNHVVLGESYLRMYVPDGFKFGGNGARVKRVTIMDDWANMTGTSGLNSSYSITYDYTKKENNKTISSGVASYEPDLGGDENPWKQPIIYKSKNGLMPDDNLYMMTPYGESLFPSANIVYSEVKTTQNPVVNASQVGTGYTINKYFTSFDFPCSVDNTILQMERSPKFSLSIFKAISHDYMATAQGYSVITNDMHGKPKSEEIFGERDILISAKYYRYKTNNTNQLTNKVKSIDDNGTISNTKLLGIETQVFGDARRYHSETYSGSVHGNFDLQIPPPFPLPSIWPDFSFEKKTYSSFSLCKHTRVQGVLDSVIVVDKGSTIYTKNLLWDEKTGAVVLTSTINEFKDPVYNFTYPAHWAYSGMGMASDNISSISRRSVPVATTNFSSALQPDFISSLEEGDILYCTGTSLSKKLLVKDLSPLQIIPLYATSSTTNLSGFVTAKVISSGKRNLATTSIGSIVSLVNPIQGNSLLIDPSTKVVDAGATEFANKCLERCDTCGKGIRQVHLTTLNHLAPWQAIASYKFVSDRTQTNPDPILRKDGEITKFSPFWSTVVNSLGNKLAPTHWQFTEKVSIIDSRLNPVESRNPLNIFSSVQQSNFDGMVNATTSNARFHENLFDGFEDVRDACAANHFAIITNPSMLDANEAHTGYYSMKTTDVNFTKTFQADGDILQGTLKDSNYTSVLCEPKFTLKPNKKYILTAWVKDRSASNTTLDYLNSNIQTSFGTGTGLMFVPKGQIVDGWQRIEEEFLTPSNTSQFTLTFSAKTNFDDIRIFPADANMKSYVYSYKDYSLLATLDENNFATFYEYDQQKQLKRVKKETEKGVMTIQEVNFGSFKN